MGINENNKVIVAQMNILEERNQGDNNQNQEQIRTVENNINKELQKIYEDKDTITSKLDLMKSENQTNTQNIVSIQESIFIQSEQVKKVESERKQATKQDKEAFQATILDNATAIADLKKKIDEALLDMVNLSDIEKRLKVSEDNIHHIDDTIDGLK